jgi:glycosyltransferase involved in cell wall biosynthesis
VGAEISLFLNKTLFPKHTTLMQRLSLNEFLPHYPDPQKTKPLIIHSPSAKIAKGSNIIVAVIEELKKEYDFEFRLLHNISRDEVLEIMKEADIFLDQIIIGGYGMASTEALAFGKPVMCYLMPELFEAGMPEECPIVNTNPDNLRQQLIKLICNPQLRCDIGKQSRKYVEKYHDLEKIAEQLLQVYKLGLETKKEKNAKTA